MSVLLYLSAQFTVSPASNEQELAYGMAKF